MKLSFIVPAHNEADYIRPTLEAIFLAAVGSGQPFEVLVVNDASTDDTGPVAASLGAQVLDVSLRNIAAVRNAGAKASDGDVLFFVDADTRISGALLAEALDVLRQGAVGGGAEFDFDGPLPLYVRLLLPLLRRRFRRKKVITASSMFCLRRHFMAVGGFDDKYLVAEDVHLGSALRKKGRMVRLQTPAMTSGRKFRENPWWRVLYIMFNIRQNNERGRKWVQDKRNLAFWYGARTRLPPS